MTGQQLLEKFQALTPEQLALRVVIKESAFGYYDTIDRIVVRRIPNRAVSTFYDPLYETVLEIE